MDVIEKEEADISLLTTMSIRIIYEIAKLHNTEKKVRWLLPIRALIMHILCGIAIRKLTARWLNIDSHIYSVSGTSVHTLAVMHRTREQLNTALRFTSKYKKELALEAILLPTMCTILALILVIGLTL